MNNNFFWLYRPPDVDLSKLMDLVGQVEKDVGREMEILQELQKNVSGCTSINLRKRSL